MILDHAKLRPAFTFMKNPASVVTLSYLLKTLNKTWNKMAPLASNSLKHAELVINEVQKTMSKNIYQYSFFIYNLSLLNVKILRGYS